MDKPEKRQFKAPQDLLQYLREKADDIDCVQIPVDVNPVRFSSADGAQVGAMANVGALLTLCSGESLVVGREDAEMLINDGILQRLNIVVKIQPFVSD